MNLIEYLKYAYVYPSLAKQEMVEPDWLPFTNFELMGPQLLIIDASYVPGAEDGLLIDMDPGTYEIDAKVMIYGIDHYVSRLRIIRRGKTSMRGNRIGETWTDVALTGICDLQVFSMIWERDTDEAWNKIETAINSSNGAGIAELDKEAGAVMPFVQSGYGDGTFPVFDLIDNQMRVGVEIEFINLQEKAIF
jgi:hypothetical protein